MLDAMAEPTDHRQVKTFCCCLVIMGSVLPALAAKTVEDRLQEYGQIADGRWLPYFKQAVVDYPPRSVAFIGLKQEKVLQVYAADSNGGFRFIRAFPILAASG